MKWAHVGGLMVGMLLGPMLVNETMKAAVNEAKSY